jgi:non-ribosomal peptide synthetase component F
LVLTPSALSVIDVALASQIVAVQVAGEAPTAQLLHRWSQVVPKIFIGLGPTEMCGHCLCGEYDGKTICIGWPARNVKTYIVDDETGLEAPTNVAGELWVSGKNICAGYLGRPELNAKHFVQDPFNPGPTQERLYKVGCHRSLNTIFLWQYSFSSRHHIFSGSKTCLLWRNFFH